LVAGVLYMMDKFSIPLPNSEGRKASFRLSEADKKKFMAAMVRKNVVWHCPVFRIRIDLNTDPDPAPDSDPRFFHDQNKRKNFEKKNFSHKLL